jgi:pyruvate/2-oxoglutarate dehydrogenase complex dihydrolipoamide acyltransferase (E2) component
MTHDILPFARERELVVDAGYLAARRHIVHGLLEVDVTVPRQILRQTSGSDGRPHSFTAFLIASLGRAIQAHPAVHAYRDLRRRLVVFHEVDVATLVEPRPGAVALPTILRRANIRSVGDLSDEIRSIQAGPHPAGGPGWLVALAPRVPRFARLLYLRGLKLNPHWAKQAQGTAIVTSVGMFGKRAGWGIAFLMSHTLGLTVGGIGERPVVHEGAVVPRECLDLTVSFDHDVVDGAPAARFARTLVEIIESGAALDTA